MSGLNTGLIPPLVNNNEHPVWASCFLLCIEFVGHYSVPGTREMVEDEMDTASALRELSINGEGREKQVDRPNDYTLPYMLQSKQREG